jgi:hypothetical protein
MWANKLGTQQATGGFFPVEKETGVEPITKFDQVPRLRMSGALPEFSHTLSWRAQAHIYTYLHHYPIYETYKCRQ